MKFRVGDRVSVTCAGGCCVDRKGEVIAAHEWIEDAWMVRFDDDGQTFPCCASIMRLDVPSTTDDNDEIIDLLRARFVKGRETYGVGVTVNDGHDWLEEAIDEALDNCVYLTAQLIDIRRKRGESR